MTVAVRLLLGVTTASLVVYAATPLAISLASRLEFYDQPAGYKAHARPTPYLGGAAVSAGLIAALLLTTDGYFKTMPLLAGVALLWLVGTVDDRRTVSPLLRVLVEIGLGWLTWKAGLGWRLHMGAGVDLVMTCLWLVAVINSFNLFDNMDGAASTMALAVSAGAALLGLARGDAWLAVGAASLGGACLGFLPRNLSFPARIFLGDGGSMPVGFVAAVLVMVAASTSVGAWQSLLVAMLLVALPALDTTLVIVSRRRRGVPVMAGGKDHLTHRARRFMPSARAVALALGGTQAMVSVLAVLAAEGGSSLVVVMAIVYTLAGLAAIAFLEGRGIAGEGDRPAQQAHAAPIAPGENGSPLGLAVLAVVAFGAGASPFFFTYYDASVWAPIGLALILACAMAVVARPAAMKGPTALAIASVFGMGVWALCSAAWTPSVQGAVLTGNRWLAYGAFLTLLLVLVRNRLRAALTLGAAGIGVMAVAMSVLVRLLGGDPSALFLGGRLNEPLGYINGEGCLFAMGFWLCMAAVESRRALLAGTAVALSTLMACLALLSQSRGTALAMLVALVAVMALIPGRVRRAYALGLIAVGLALAGPSLLHVYGNAKGGAVSLQAAHGAGRAALLAAVLTGIAWGLATGLWEAIHANGRLSSARTAASWALALPAVVALVLAAGSAHSIGHELSMQWRAFTHLETQAAAAKQSEPGVFAQARRSSVASHSDGPSAPEESASRLLSGAGNRYDYWRIAWDLWHEHPIAGVGAGGYAPYYYERRDTTEDVDQPHSIELETLGDLGLVGAVLLALFFGAVAWAILRLRPFTRVSPPIRACAVGATGSFTVWAVQSSVDWMHLLPGLTAIALIAAAALMWPGTQARSHRGRVLGVCAVLATLVVSGGSLSRQALAQLYADRASSELVTHPLNAVTDADRSLRINSDATQTYYVKAAALARFDEADAAIATLQQAITHEARNFVTWALLGDVAVRERRLRQARDYYRHAHALNPRSAMLAALAANPVVAAR